MSVEKLQQDILFCQQTIKNIVLKHYDQDRYMDMIDIIFKDIFQDYLKESGIIKGLHAENKCPDKLEPREGYIPKEGLRIIRKKLGIEDNEPL
tara:strand:+ start:138 stop:416 length:279 start_codon:yes stop_codon:yes gene_type:complete